MTAVWRVRLACWLSAFTVALVALIDSVGPICRDPEGPRSTRGLMRHPVTPDGRYFVVRGGC